MTGEWFATKEELEKVRTRVEDDGERDEVRYKVKNKVVGEEE